MKHFIKGQILHAPTNNRTKGVLIGIATYLEFQIEHKEMDKERRFILVKDQLNCC